MKKSVFFLFLILVFLLFAGASCFQFQTGGGDKGVFKSVDQGEHWQKKDKLLSLTAGASIGGVNASVLAADPQDSGVLYLGTEENGLFLSIDAADSWQEISRLPKGSINAIAVSPKASHIVYLGLDNRILKTSNCCRTWENLYLAEQNIKVVALAIHPFSPEMIFAGLSDGRLIKSDNHGYRWKTLQNFDGKIKQILINQKNPSIIYVFPAGKGIFRSEDNGNSWSSLAENLKDYSKTTNISKAVFIPTDADGLIIASNHGLLLTRDGGRSWSDYKLLTAPGQAKISSLAVNPKNPQIIYYTVEKTLYKTFDNGANWITRSLPSKQKIVDLLIDQANPNILYLIYQKQPKTYGF